MNKKDLYAVLKDKIRIAWVEVFTDPEAGDGLRVWFEAVSYTHLFADGHFYIECIGVFLAVSAEGARRDEEI